MLNGAPSLAFPFPAYANSSTHAMSHASLHVLCSLNGAPSLAFPFPPMRTHPHMCSSHISHHVARILACALFAERGPLSGVPLSRLCARIHAYALRTCLIMSHASLHVLCSLNGPYPWRFPSPHMRTHPHMCSSYCMHPCTCLLNISHSVRLLIISSVKISRTFVAPQYNRYPPTPVIFLREGRLQMSHCPC